MTLVVSGSSTVSVRGCCSALLIYRWPRVQVLRRAMAGVATDVCPARCKGGGEGDRSYSCPILLPSFREGKQTVDVMRLGSAVRHLGVWFLVSCAKCLTGRYPVIVRGLFRATNRRPGKRFCFPVLNFSYQGICHATVNRQHLGHEVFRSILLIVIQSCARIYGICPVGHVLPTGPSATNQDYQVGNVVILSGEGFGRECILPYVG